MSWERGGPQRRPRAALVAAAILAAVLAVGFLTRRPAPVEPVDTLEIGTERPVPSPAPSVATSALQVAFPDDTGLVLWTVNTAGGLTRLDLDTGATETAQVMNVGTAGVLVQPAGEGVVVVRVGWREEGDVGEAWYVAAPSVAPVALGPALSALPSVTPGRVWLVGGAEFLPPAGSVPVREVALDGSVTAETVLPPGVWPRAAVEGGLLVDAAGTVLVYDPVAARGRLLGPGAVVAADARRLIRRVCDASLRCGFVMGTPRAPSAATIPATPEAEVALAVPYAGATLSPSGRWAALWAIDAEAGRLAVFDTATGELRLSPRQPQRQGMGTLLGSVPGAWAPSDGWLFAPTGEGVAAWNVESGLVASIEIPGTVAVAVTE